jgi:hypothetical protein
VTEAFYRFPLDSHRIPGHQAQKTTSRVVPLFCSRDNWSAGLTTIGRLFSRQLAGWLWRLQKLHSLSMRYRWLPFTAQRFQGRLRGGVQCAGLFILINLFFFVGCSSGELNLSRGEPDSGTSSGGQGSQSGGEGFDDDDPLEPPSGSGGQGVDPPPPEEGERIPPPCLLTGLCECPPGVPDCFDCVDEDSCNHHAPHCDNSLGRCVECLGDDDCVQRYGDAFGLCSAGRCVQCQRNDDCPGEIRCDLGFCGTCENDFSCNEGERCFLDHCVPDDL